MSSHVTASSLDRQPATRLPPPAPRTGRRGTQTAGIGSEHGWTTAAVAGAAVLALPVVAVLWLAASSGQDSIWPHLVSTVLPGSLATTLALLLGTGLLTLIVGTAAAWLVTMFHFPGRALADRLLVLPLAMPAYIVAYAYVDLLDYAGPVQSALRAAFGYASARDYAFPEVRSLPGAILIFASVLYPYVYLTARASFVQQSVCVLEVARTLGETASGAFRSVALPLARPALAAGVALVAMECLNDLGAVQYLGVETLSASIAATWLQRANLAGAAQLASVMLALVAVLMIIEHAARGLGGTQATTGRLRAIPFETLTGWRAALTLTAVLLPFVLGFALPFAVLITRAVGRAASADTASFVSAAKNSLILAMLASVFAVSLAMLFAYAARLQPGPATRISVRAVSLGYALPGTVLAIGLLSPLAAFDNTLDAWMRSTAGVSTGLLLSGSLFAVTFALVIRFLAVAIGSVEAGFGRISSNLDAAARTLGASPWSTLSRVHLPILAPALGAAALLVFVDAMKELPATLLLRPFNFETLATHVYALTAAEQFEEAALGAVTIVVIGLIPVLLLHNAIARGRTGGQT